MNKICGFLPFLLIGCLLFQTALSGCAPMLSDPGSRHPFPLTPEEAAFTLKQLETKAARTLEEEMLYLCALWTIEPHPLTPARLQACLDRVEAKDMRTLDEEILYLYAFYCLNPHSKSLAQLDYFQGLKARGVKVTPLPGKNQLFIIDGPPPKSLR